MAGQDYQETIENLIRYPKRLRKPMCDPRNESYRRYAAIDQRYGEKGRNHAIC